MELSTLIARSQSGDKDSLMTLIKKFEPLLKKYASKCDCEDAHSELLLSFITLIVKAIDVDCFSCFDERGVLKYIKSSIHHAYIAFSKRQYKLHLEIPFSYFETLENPMPFDNYISEYDDYFAAELESLSNILTPKETEVIKLVYVLGYPSKKAAEILRISSSAVSQIKNRALNKLKKIYANNAIISIRSNIST